VRDSFHAKPTVDNFNTKESYTNLDRNKAFSFSTDDKTQAGVEVRQPS
jgi:hypothetical protein